MAVYPESDPANGLPFCYYQADPSKPQSEWSVKISRIFVVDILVLKEN